MTSNANLLTVKNVSIPSSSLISIRDHSAITMQKKTIQLRKPTVSFMHLDEPVFHIKIHFLGREKSKRTGIKQMLSLKSIPGSIPARSLAGLQSCGMEQHV